MTATDLARTATTPHDDEPNGRSQAAIEVGLETRNMRLEQFTSGLAAVLDRLQGNRLAATATVFEDFDDPGAGNEALDVLFAACSNVRRDLSALRLELAELKGISDAASERPPVTRLRLLGTSANELAGRFEEYRRSRDVALPPRSPGGVVRLDEFVGMAVRALHDIAEAAESVRPRQARFPIAAAFVAPEPFLPIPPAQPRPSVAAVAVPVAGALWHVVRRRRTRLMLEFAAVVLVGVIVGVAALNQGEEAPGSVAGLESPSVAPSRSGDTGVAVGGGSPSPLQPAGTSTPGTTPGSAPAPAQSSAPPAPTQRPATPRPTRPPAPSPTPPTAVTRFNDRIATAADSIDGLLSTITTAVHDGDLPSAKTGAEEIASIATAEQSWLLSHPAAACFESFQESALATYGDLIATATSIAENADAGDGNAIHQEVGTSHGDVSALRQAGTKAVTACA